MSVALHAATTKVAAVISIHLVIFYVLIPLTIAQKVMPSVPSCRKSPDMHWLNVPVEGSTTPRGELVYFGGKGWVWATVQKAKYLTYDKEVTFFGNTYMWNFNLQYNAWFTIAISHMETPQKRWKQASATFNGGSQIVLFGGCNTTEATGVLNDLWVFTAKCCGNQAEWRRIHTTNPPRPRRSHAVVTNRTHVIVFGGKGTGVDKNDPNSIYTDLWALPLAALRTTPGSEGVRYSWTQGKSAPFGRRWGITGTLMVTPEGREVMVVFGGRMFSGKKPPAPKHTYYNELWLYDLAADSWKQAKPRGQQPSPRDHHAATVSNNELFMFGGRVDEQATASSVVNDLWSYSLKSKEWTLRVAYNTSVAPGPRYMPAMTDALIHGQHSVIISSGEGLPGSTTETSLNDVWSFVPGSGEGWKELIGPTCDLVTHGTIHMSDFLPLLFGILFATMLFGSMALWKRHKKAKATEIGGDYLLLA